MSPVTPDRPPRGLSERLKQLDQDLIPLPDFDLDAVVRGGRRRDRRRKAASVIGTAATVAAVATALTLGPLNHRANAPSPAKPVATATATPTATATATAATDVPPDHLDTGHLTTLRLSAGAGTAAGTIAYDRVLCDDAKDAQQEKISGMTLCLIGNAGGPGQAGDAPGIDQHSVHRARLAPGAVVIGSIQLETFLGKKGTAQLDWFQLPAKDRHVSLTDLSRFLQTHTGRTANFRLHFDGAGQVDRISEVYQE